MGDSGGFNRLTPNLIAYFQSLKVAELKAELRKRGASLKGRKSELYDRLIYYIKNSNFQVPTPSSIDNIINGDGDAPMWTPDCKAFKDINANSCLPPVSQGSISRWAGRFHADFSKGKEMYEARYLSCARFCIHSDSNSTFLRGICHAQMKKAVSYMTDIELNSTSGEMKKAHCECTAGSGETAHCKHVFALMFGVEQMCTEKKITLRAACTQQLQTFHHPSEEYFGTPVKAHNLKCGVKTGKNTNYQPFDTSSINKRSYKDRVRNLCVNFAASNPQKKKIPLTTLFEPANPYAIVWDHAYAKLSWEQCLLKEFKLMAISKEEIEAIEEETRGQSSNKKWVFLRCTHLTTSRFYVICHAVSDEAKRNLAKRMVNVQVFGSAATDHGMEFESKAIDAFEKATGLKVLRPGIIISFIHPYLASSLDGIVNGILIVEVKCPLTAKNMPINEITVPYLKKDENGNLSLDSESEYFYQIQGQMMVTGKQIAVLVVYTLTDMKVINVPRNEPFIQSMMCILEEFYEKYFKPALFEKYIFKYYDKYIKCDHYKISTDFVSVNTQKE